MTTDTIIVVSAEVKNSGRDIEVNSINTIFGRRSLSEVHDELIYTSETITPEQQSLLNGNNPHQYPAEREPSTDKVSNTSSNSQDNDILLRPETGLPNTNNALEGVFSDIKSKTRVHSGISRDNRKKLLDEYIKRKY